MQDVAVTKAFENVEARKCLYDFTQFQTRILTSRRGGGKTWLCDEYLLNRYRHGKYFVAVRESQVEIDNLLAGGFWDQKLIATPEYKDLIFTTRGNKIMINGQVVGMAFALTTYNRVRGSQAKFDKITPAHNALEAEIKEVENFVASIENLETIYFDEFEPLTPTMTPEKRFETFLHMAETFFRFRPNVCVVMSANLEKAYSPFLYKFGFGDLLELTPGTRKSYTLPDSAGRRQPLAVWCHMATNPEWDRLRDNSYVGKLVRGSDKGMFTTGDAYVGKNFRKAPAESKPHRAILYNITDGISHLTFWKTKDKVHWYITRRTKNTMFPTFTWNIKAVGPGISLFPAELEKRLITIFNQSKIEFEDAAIYEQFINMLPAKKRI